MIFWLHVAFFLSGAAALIFENLWFRQVGLAVGNSVWASSLVLAAFMAGLALGNGLAAARVSRARRPLALYAALELLIAVAGWALVAALPHLNQPLAPVLRAVSNWPALQHAVRLAFAFALLVVPTTGMGMTLPLLAEALERWRDDFGANLGSLYGWNTLGAVAGALVVEVLLIGPLGLRGSGAVAAALGGMAAAAALVLDMLSPRRSQPPPAAPASRLAISAPATRLAAAAFLAGALLLGLEVVWFRFLLLFVNGTRLTFAILLAVVLAGIGLGGLAASAWLSRRRDAVDHARTLAMLAGLAAVSGYVAFGDLIALIGDTASGWPWLRTGWLALGLMAPVSFASGILFTLVGTALQHRIGGHGTAAGLLTLGNTAGAMVGALLSGFVLLPSLGIERSLALLAGGYGVIALVLPRLAPERRDARRLSWAAAAGLLSFLLLFPFGLMERRYLLIPLGKIAEGDTRIVAAREGLTETAVYLEEHLQGERLLLRLVTNGFSMSSTSYRARRYMRLYVDLPVAIHPGLKSALLISYGVGNTARALVRTGELERIDVVDVSRDILELSREVLPAPHPLDDPRVHVHVEDGRHFLQLTERSYDLITAEPPPPKQAGIESLYSQEYFELIRERLAPGGLVSYWLPAHALHPEELKAIVRGFCNALPDCSLWNGASLDWMLLGTREAAGPVSERRFTAPWSDPVRHADMIDSGVETPEQLGALFLADASGLARLAGETPPLRDDWPRRIDRAPASVVAPYRELMETGRAGRAFAASPLIDRLWPPALRGRTGPAFDEQRLHNDLFWGDPAGPAGRLDALHRIVTGTSLSTLVVLLLESDPDLQRVATALASQGARGPWLLLQRSIAALAERAYADAAARARAALPSPALPLARFLLCYALALDGRLDEAGGELSEWARDSPPLDPATARFFEDSFGLRPSEPDGP